MPNSGLLTGTFKGGANGLASGTYNGTSAGLKSVSSGLNTYNAETIAWVKQLSAPRPSPRYLNAINTLITTLKSGGIWQQLDRFWIFATEQQSHARVSLVNPNGISATWPTNIDEINSPSWTAKQGYTGNGSNSYLRSNWIPSSAGINYKLNNAAIGVYSRTNRSGGETEIGGNAGSNLSALNCSWVGYTHAYNNTSTNTNIVQSDTRGLFSAVRVDSAWQQAIKNGSFLGQVASASTSLTSVQLYICAFNGGGAANNFSQKQLSMAYVGAGTINQALFYSIFQKFAVKVGFNV